MLHGSEEHPSLCFAMLSLCSPVSQGCLAGAGVLEESSSFHSGPLPGVPHHHQACVPLVLKSFKQVSLAKNNMLLKGFFFPVNTCSSSYLSYLGTVALFL